MVVEESVDSFTWDPEVEVREEGASFLETIERAGNERLVVMVTMGTKIFYFYMKNSWSPTWSSKSPPSTSASR